MKIGNKKNVYRILILFVLGVFLTVGISPVFSQTPPFLPIYHQVKSQIIAQAKNSAPQLVQAGKNHYDAGQYQQAVNKLKQAVERFASQEDKLNQAITLSNLSLAYQQLGEWQAAEISITKSLEILDFKPQTQLTGKIPQPSHQNLQILAPVLDIYGRLLYMRSQPATALKSWELTANIYEKLGKPEKKIGSQINQVRAMQALGLYQQARNTIQQMQQNLNNLPAPLKLQGLLSLGDVLRAVGNLPASREFLEKSITIAQQLKSPPDLGAAWLSLGNTFYALGNLESDRRLGVSKGDIIPWQCHVTTLPKEALTFYKQADNAYQQVTQTLSNNSSLGTKAQLNRLNLLTDRGEFTTALQVWKDINLSQLSLSRMKVYGEINLARNLSCLRQQANISQQVPSWQEIDNLLNKAVEGAAILADNNAKSYAIGNRGSLYEYLAGENLSDSQTLKTAQKLTQAALLLAQPSESPTIAYQWQWQLGRLFKLEKNREKAISAYQDAVITLTSVRGDLLNINSDVQFSFRDNVEPVYRQLVDLLLKREGNAAVPEKNLVAAINLIDSLQLAELENFLRCHLDSLARDNRSITQQIEQKAAFIYPIILKDRLELIFKLPGHPLKHYVNRVQRTVVQKTVQQLRKAIVRRNPERFREHSQTIYQWLIKPLEVELKTINDIENLVFVLDAELRNIPMAVLYDKEANEYLVEKKYALAVLPNSQLFDLWNSQLNLNILAAGISEEVEVKNHKFAAINAKDELNEIADIASTETLLNTQFNKKNLQQKLRKQNFSVVHLATHGNFSSNPEETYILTYDELLKPNDLDNLLTSNQGETSNKIDLLVLSACQTASGDNRATLGLAGIAVRAGAGSTLATLWKVSDDFTIRLIKGFYQELKTGASKAEALHRAQKSLVYEQNGKRKYQNEPYNWAPYVLVGNWQ